MSDPTSSRSFPQLLSDLTDGLGNLFQKESELVRAEIREKAARIEIGAGSMVAGAICLIVALNVLAGALVIALANVMGAGWAALAVGATIAVIGALLIGKGNAEMKSLKPERSLRQFSQDASLAKDQLP